MNDLVLLSDLTTGVTARASSVLQKNSKLYGPTHALDCKNLSTCWNSDGSSSGKQGCWYMLEFGRLVQPAELRVQFQAGFSAEEVLVEVRGADSKWKPLIDLEVDDDHDLQTFLLQEEATDAVPATNACRFSFSECSDFYGRITIYQLQVWGHETSNGATAEGT